MLEGKNAVNEATAGVCEPLMPDVVALKVHQNKLSYVSSADLLLDLLHKNNSMVGSYMEDLENPQNCQNWGVGVSRLWMLAWDNTVLQSEDSPTTARHTKR